MILCQTPGCFFNQMKRNSGGFFSCFFLQNPSSHFHKSYHRVIWCFKWYNTEGRKEGKKMVLLKFPGIESHFTHPLYCCVVVMNTGRNSPDGWNFMWPMYTVLLQGSSSCNTPWCVQNEWCPGLCNAAVLVE